MTINVFYVQQDKNLTLFTQNTEDFNFLNRFLLTIQQLSNQPDEDCVPLKIIHSCPSQHKIIITSNFLLTRVPQFSKKYGGSVIELLQDNGIILIPKTNIEPQEVLRPIEEYIRTFSLKPLFYWLRGSNPSIVADATSHLIEKHHEGIPDEKLAKSYGVSVKTVQKIIKHI